MEAEIPSYNGNYTNHIFNWLIKVDHKNINIRKINFTEMVIVFYMQNVDR